MLKLQHKLLRWNGSGMTAAAIFPLILGTAAIAVTAVPAAAQSVIVVEGGYNSGYNSGVVVRQSPQNNPTPFIFGSPIATPVPVNPYTGLTPSHNSTTYYYSYPSRRRIEDSTLINPVLVNPRIRDSTLINPVIVDDPVERDTVRFRRSRSIRVISP